MLYDVEQVASKLNVSKVTIYNKLKLKQYKDKILVKQGKTYIDDDLLKMIQDNLKTKVNVNPNDTTEPQEELQDEDNTINNEDILNINKELIKTLIDQLKEKDTQIHELHKLIENNQVLLREKPQQDIKLLEEHFKDLDNRLFEVRERMEEKKQKSKKGIFYRIRQFFNSNN